MNLLSFLPNFLIQTLSKRFQGIEDGITDFHKPSKFFKFNNNINPAT